MWTDTRFCVRKKDYSNYAEIIRNYRAKFSRIATWSLGIVQHFSEDMQDCYTTD